MPPKKKVPPHLVAARAKRHQAQAPWQQEQQPDADVEMPDVVGLDEPVVGPGVSVVAAADAPRLPRPRGPTPKVDGCACDWDGEVGCWRRPDGGEHVVVEWNEKAKAETAKAKAEEERRRVVRERREEAARKVAAYSAKSLADWREMMETTAARDPKLMAHREALHAAKRAMRLGGPDLPQPWEAWCGGTGRA